MAGYDMTISSTIGIIIGLISCQRNKIFVLKLFVILVYIVVGVYDNAVAVPYIHLLPLSERALLHRQIMSYGSADLPYKRRLLGK